MSYSKIKKHFSLFMVKKSIKKKQLESEDFKKASDSKEVIKDEEKSHKNTTQTLQKYLDPIICHHLPGDIYFYDKLNEPDIGLLSTSNLFKTIIDVNYNEKHNLWLTNLRTYNDPLDSWGLVYDRLMSLGDAKAYELAKTIEIVCMSTPKKQEFDDNFEIDNWQTYQYFLNDLDNLFKTIENSAYFCAKYEATSKQRGLELKMIGISKKLVELVYGEISVFLDYHLNFGLFDFNVIDKENYFDFVKNRVLCLNAKNNSMKIKFQTLDGHYIYLEPLRTTKAYMNETGQILELMLIFEFFPSEEFIQVVQESRENKTKIRRKKSNRERDLENILLMYYKHEDFKKKVEIKEKVKTNETSAMKRCGFASISLKNN